MKKGQLILLAALLAIGTGWLLKLKADHPAVNAVLTSAPRISSEEADFTSLEQSALESCICRRENGAEAGCEANFNQARVDLMREIYGDQMPPQLAGSATACAPVSTEFDCFEFTDGEICVATGYYVNGASNSFENREVCSADEARAIEAAYNEGSFEGVDAMLRQILAGEPVPQVEPMGGCAG